MPVAHVAHRRRDLKGRGLDCGLGPDMGDQAIIPRIAFLMAQKNEMPRHRVFGIWRFQHFRQLDGFASGSLAKVPVVNIVARRRRRSHSWLFTWRSFSANQRERTTTGSFTRRE